MYVEGPGDRLCLETLLGPLIATKLTSGIQIQFVPMTRGDRKVALLRNAPVRAASILRNDPATVVVILPDLYPPNKGFDHSTCAEMQAGIGEVFRRHLERSRVSDDRLAERFHVFCLIHDLEVLLLAAEESLVAISGQAPKWKKPVEEQNHHEPPKRIVERLIPRYNATIDGPRVLASADYRTVAERCPNGFGRFVSFLESL